MSEISVTVELFVQVDEVIDPVALEFKIRSEAIALFCSESTTLRVLRDAGKIPVYVKRSRPVQPRPELDASEPNRAWRYDGTQFLTRAGIYHVIPVIDACSRKITGRYFGAEHLRGGADRVGKGARQRRTVRRRRAPTPGRRLLSRSQMTSCSTKAFSFDLGSSGACRGRGRGCPPLQRASWTFFENVSSAPTVSH